MARTLVLMRHAKAAWPNDVRDRERPLTERGRRDAPEAGRWLVAQGVRPELVIVSDARRTRETCDLVIAQLPVPPKVRVTRAAYAAGAGDLLEVVREIDPDVSSTMLVAHNPGIGVLAHVLDEGGPAAIDDIATGYPTAALTVLELTRPWESVDPGTARRVAFVVPRASDPSG